MADYDQQKLAKWLSEKWRQRLCPMCNAGNWNVGPEVYQLLQYSGANFVIGGPVMPVIPIVCSNCGNTMLVNALVAEVVEVPEQQKPIAKGDNRGK